MSSNGSGSSTSVRVTQVDPSLPLQPYQESTLSLALSSGSRGSGSRGSSRQSGDQESVDAFFNDRDSSGTSSFNLYDKDSSSSTETETRDVREMELYGGVKKGRKPARRIPARTRAMPRFHVEIDRGEEERHADHDTSSTLSSNGASFGGSSCSTRGSDKSAGTRSRQSSIRSDKQETRTEQTRKQETRKHEARKQEQEARAQPQQETAVQQQEPQSLSHHAVALMQRITRLKQLLQLFNTDPEFDADFDAEDEACIAADIQKAEHELHAALRMVPPQFMMKFKLECTIRRREILLEQAILAGKLDPEKDEGVFGYFVKKQVKLMELL